KRPAESNPCPRRSFTDAHRTRSRFALPAAISAGAKLPDSSIHPTTSPAPVAAATKTAPILGRPEPPRPPIPPMRPRPRPPPQTPVEDRVERRDSRTQAPMLQGKFMTSNNRRADLSRFDLKTFRP